MPAYTKKKKGEENKGGKEEEEDVIKDKDDDDDDISDKAELKINSDVSLTRIYSKLFLIFSSPCPSSLVLSTLLILSFSLCLLLILSFSSFPYLFLHNKHSF